MVGGRSACWLAGRVGGEEFLGCAVPRPVPARVLIPPGPSEALAWAVADVVPGERPRPQQNTQWHSSRPAFPTWGCD